MDVKEMAFDQTANPFERITERLITKRVADLEEQNREVARDQRQARRPDGEGRVEKTRGERPVRLAAGQDAAAGAARGASEQRLLANALSNPHNVDQKHGQHGQHQPVPPLLCWHEKADRGVHPGVPAVSGGSYPAGLPAGRHVRAGDADADAQELRPCGHHDERRQLFRDAGHGRFLDAAGARPAAQDRVWLELRLDPELHHLLQDHARDPEPAGVDHVEQVRGVRQGRQPGNVPYVFGPAAQVRHLV
ncbi:hypothetical protein KL939_000934 [Ogataea angusta]|nr:hypothetical protein KL939_000934 [Ogataea angusta]